MNTTFSIRVDEQLKKSFLEKTKSRGIDGSVVIRHFMQKISANPELIKFDIEDEVFYDILKNKSTKNKLIKISSKLDELGF
ncbi:MAG: hypothetical protein PHI37_02865 [Candidatus Gracilibacteria bacterium]|nr:hypothetical protein [Candidatus Gracilibacteria bacterium]